MTNPHRKNRGWKDGQKIRWSEEFICGKPPSSIFPKTGMFQSWNDVFLAIGCFFAFIVSPIFIVIGVHDFFSAPGPSAAQIDTEYREMRRNQYEQSIRDMQREAIDQYRAKEGI